MRVSRVNSFVRSLRSHPVFAASAVADRYHDQQVQVEPLALHGMSGPCAAVTPAQCRNPEDCTTAVAWTVTLRCMPEAEADAMLPPTLAKDR